MLERYLVFEDVNIENSDTDVPNIKKKERENVLTFKNTAHYII